MCWEFSIAIICKDQFFFSLIHSRNTMGFRDPNVKAAVPIFSAISSVNNYIKTFYENNIFFETQDDCSL